MQNTQMSGMGQIQPTAGRLQPVMPACGMSKVNNESLIGSQKGSSLSAVPSGTIRSTIPQVSLASSPSSTYLNGNNSLPKTGSLPSVNGITLPSMTTGNYNDYSLPSNNFDNSRNGYYSGSETPGNYNGSRNSYSSQSSNNYNGYYSGPGTPNNYNYNHNGYHSPSNYYNGSRNGSVSPRYNYSPTSMTGTNVSPSSINGSRSATGSVSPRPQQGNNSPTAKQQPKSFGRWFFSF